MRVPRNQVSLIGDTARFAPETGTSALFNEVAGATDAIADDLQAKADNILVSDYVASSRRDAREIYQNNADNPDQLRKELDSYKEGLMKNIPSRLAAKLNDDYFSLSEKYISRATEQQNKFLTAQARIAQDQEANQIIQDLGFATRNLFENTDGLSEEELKVKQLTSVERITKDLSELNRTFSKIGNDGQLLMSPDKIVNSTLRAQQYVFSEAGRSFLDAQPNKLAAYNQWLNDEVTYETPEGVINVRQSLTPEVRKKMDNELVSAVRRDNFLKKEQRQQEQVRAEQYKSLKTVTQAVRNEITLDPTNKDDRKAVDDAWLQMQDQIIKEEGNINDILGSAADLTTKTGIMPKQIESIIAGNILNGDVEQRVAYSDYLTKVADDNPRALREVDSNVSAMAVSIRKNLDAGLDPERAVAWAQADIDKASKETRDFRKSNWKDKKENQKTLKSLVTDLQDEPGFDLFKTNPRIPDSLQAEYLRLEEQFYVNENVNRKEAAKLAQQQIRQVWQQTEIGPKRFMKYAPEAFYGNSAGTEWIESQLLEQTGLTKGSAALEVNPDTITGDQPSYFITTINEFNSFDILLDENNQPVQFKPDFKSTKEFKEQQEKAASLNPSKTELSNSIAEQRKIDAIFMNVF